MAGGNVQGGLAPGEAAAFGQYTFAEGAGREYAYRLDFVTAAEQEDYYQLFRDAGWEHVGE